MICKLNCINLLPRCRKKRASYADKSVDRFMSAMAFKYYRQARPHSFERARCRENRFSSLHRPHNPAKSIFETKEVDHHRRNPSIRFFCNETSKGIQQKLSLSDKSLSNEKGTKDFGR